MITATVLNHGYSVEVEFPCGEDALFKKLQRIGVTDPLDTDQLLVRNCGRELSELSALDGGHGRLDFLNFLAKRLESLSEPEERQFRAALLVSGSRSIADMINLTYNLHNYTLIDSFENLRDVGKRHFLNCNGSMTRAEQNETDFKTVGLLLLSSDRGVVTPYGVLFENGLEQEKVFNGRTLPEYLYRECAYTVTASHGGGTEYLYLPDDDIAIRKAAQRLGAGGIEECKVEKIDSMALPNADLSCFCADITRPDIPAFNRFSKAVLEFENTDFEKLKAVARYAGVRDFGGAARLAENLDSFLCVPNVHDAEELGRYLIRKSHEYAYDDRLDDFYNYERLGNFTAEQQEGGFGESGYVGVSDPDRMLTEILGGSGAEQTMGGM